MARPTLTVIVSGTGFNKNLSCIIREATAGRTLTFPKTTRSSGAGAFSCAVQLRAIVLNGSATQEGRRMFERCGSLRRICVRGDCHSNIRNGVSGLKIVSEGEIIIGTNYLRDLKRLRQVMIPPGVDRIGNYWFANSGVETVVLPASIREIGEEAFRGCKSLTQVVLARKSKLQAIETNCFRGSGVQDVGFSTRLKHIDEGAFSKCAALRSRAARLRTSGPKRSRGPASNRSPRQHRSAGSAKGPLPSAAP